mgnify:FL=1
MTNPLLQKFRTPYQAVPFDQIKNDHFIPALKKSIQIALNEIDTIVNQKEEPTFSNTLDALDNCGLLVSRISSIIFNLNSAETSTELQQVSQEAAPLLTQFQNDIRLNEKLFERIKRVYESTDSNKLSAEEKTLLEKEFKGFVRNGALLSKKEKEKLREIDTTLAQLSLTFGENVLADTQAFSMHLTQKQDLAGLPNNVIEMAAAIAQQRKLEGWVFTLDYPSYVPFMTYAENRKLRKEMALAFGKRGFQENSQNNIENIKEIIRLRKERASVLGFSSHAAFVLEERMAKSEKEALQFLEKLYEKALPAAKKEWEAMEEFGSNLGISPLERWDTAYVGEKLKQKKFSFDEQLLKPYLPLNHVLEGMFSIAKKLYGLSFKAKESLPVYHDEVIVYEVTHESKGFYALLYTDFFPRPGKRNGAWMTSYLPQKKGQRPHISIVCNFSRATNKQPSLLTFQEVTTMFHEFGHALHGMLAETTYSGLSGTNVFWDFVELPSQIMENWCYQPEALALFTKHYETEDTLPLHFVEKIKKSAQFQQGLQTLRQLGFGFLDLSYHGEHINKIVDIKDHEKVILDKVQFTEDQPNNCTSTAFSHIFQGGYAAGYYSYKWAEVLDADAFELFLEKGIFDTETAQSFVKNILSKGGTEHPMILYKRFRGRTPDPEALLRRAGLT